MTNIHSLTLGLEDYDGTYLKSRNDVLFSLLPAVKNSEISAKFLIDADEK